jgi:hypothetical protein
MKGALRLLVERLYWTTGDVEMKKKTLCTHEELLGIVQQMQEQNGFEGTAPRDAGTYNSFTLDTPPTMGECADKLYLVGEEKRKHTREVKRLGEIEAALKKHFIKEAPQICASGVFGKLASVSIVQKRIPIVSGEVAFREYLFLSKRFYLANKFQPSRAAVSEAWADGEDIPGVEPFPVNTLSIKKIGV